MPIISGANASNSSLLVPDSANGDHIVNHPVVLGGAHVDHMTTAAFFVVFVTRVDDGGDEKHEQNSQKNCGNNGSYIIASLCVINNK